MRLWYYFEDGFGIESAFVRKGKITHLKAEKKKIVVILVILPSFENNIPIKC
jgi:hypothetical protein